MLYIIINIIELIVQRLYEFQKYFIFEKNVYVVIILVEGFDDIIIIYMCDCVDIFFRNKMFLKFVQFLYC